MTWSPFVTEVTPAPPSTTTPAPSWPRIAGNKPSGSAPESVNSSVWQTPVALTSIMTSPSRGPSSWTVVISSGLPAAVATAARTSMAVPHFRWLLCDIGRAALRDRGCRPAYDQALNPANETGLRKVRRSRGSGDFRPALEYRLHRDQICPPRRRSADLSRDSHGDRGGADGDHLRNRPPGMA